jgi:hypothetical protein
VERGSIDPANEISATVFVFEGLIAELGHPRAYWLARKLGRWERSLDAWDFDYQVLDYLDALINRYHIPVQVITWQPTSFAHVLHDRLYDLGAYVRSTTSTRYSSASPRIAVDPTVAVVYDVDPDHRFGYGFKARDFILERVQ